MGIFFFFGGFQKFVDLKYLNFCEIINYLDFYLEYFVIFIVVICFIVMIVIYIRIFCVVWKVSIELMIVYKDGLYNIKVFRIFVFIVGIFVVCWFLNFVF